MSPRKPTEESKARPALCTQFWKISSSLSLINYILSLKSGRRKETEEMQLRSCLAVQLSSSKVYFLLARRYSSGCARSAFVFSALMPTRSASWILLGFLRSPPHPVRAGAIDSQRRFAKSVLQRSAAGLRSSTGAERGPTTTVDSTVDSTVAATE